MKSGMSTCYWVNGTRTDLSVVNSDITAEALSIAAVGSTVYVSGYTINASIETPCYWVNGVSTELSVSDSTGQATFSSAAGIRGRVLAERYIEFRRIAATHSGRKLPPSCRPISPRFLSLPYHNGKEQRSMARRRIGMKALRQVIELHENTQFSNRQIAAATGVSRPAVADYIAAYDR